MAKYDDLSREQLIELLIKRERMKKLGLVWERDEIEADNAIDANFVAATIVHKLSDKPSPWRNMVIEGDSSALLFTASNIDVIGTARQNSRAICGQRSLSISNRFGSSSLTNAAGMPRSVRNVYLAKFTADVGVANGTVEDVISGKLGNNGGPWEAEKPSTA